MAKGNGYNVVACDVNGKEIYTSHVTRKVEAGRVAREFLAYSNVCTVDMDNAQYGNCGDRVGMYVKTSGRTAIYIPATGQIKRARIAF